MQTVKGLTSARAEIQKHNAEEFFCEPPDFENYKYYSLQSGRNTVFRRRLSISKDKKIELIPCCHSPIHQKTEELQRCQGREKVSVKYTHLMHFLTPYIHL